jgi:hypothetical protein
MHPLLPEEPESGGLERLEPRVLLTMISSVWPPGPGSTTTPVLQVSGETVFDGQDDYMQFADSAALNTNRYSIAFWFKADAPGTGAQTLVARGEDWKTDKAQWVVELNDAVNPGKVQLWYEDGTDGDHYFPTQTAIQSGRWYHFAATRSSNGEVTIYLDGQVELKKKDATAPVRAATPVTMGARRNAPAQVQEFFDGAIRDLSVFNAVLDAQAIGTLLNQTRPTPGAGPLLRVNPTGWNADVAAASDGRFVVTWQDGQGSNADVLARCYDAQGTPLGAAFPVNTATAGEQSEPEVAMAPDGRFLVVWQAVDSGPVSGMYSGVFARLFADDGTPLGDEFRVDQGSATTAGQPGVDVDGRGNFVVVWGGSAIRYQRFDGDGNRLGAEATIEAGPLDYSGNPEVAVNARGEFVIAYNASQYTTSRYVTFDAAGRQLASGQMDNAYDIGLDLNDQGFFVISSVVYTGLTNPYMALVAQVYDVNGAAVGTPITVTGGKNGGLDWDIYESAVAMSDGGFVVSWRDYDFNPNGTDWHHGIYFARFDLDGRSLGAEVKASDYDTGAFNMNPAAALTRAGRLTLVWQDLWGETGVFARQFDCGRMDLNAPPTPLFNRAGPDDFDGKDDVLTTRLPGLNISSYTITLWFKADYPEGATQTLIARGENSQDKAQWVVQLNAAENPGKVQLWWEDWTDKDYIYATTTSIVADKWYHFAATRSADGEVRIYLDGRLEAAAAHTPAPVSIDAPVRLGARTDAPDKLVEYFNGALQSVRVYGEPLSALALHQIRRQTAPAPDPGGLVYQHDAPILLNGVDQYVEVADSPRLNTRDYTLAMSFKADNPAAGTQVLLARGENWANDKAQWVIELNDSTHPGQLQLWYEDPGSSSTDDHYFTVPTPIEAGKWYHVVVTRSVEGLVRIYLDGQLVLEKTDPATPSRAAMPVLIGARRETPNTVAEHFRGTIENVRIYDTALSPDEVRAIVPAPRLNVLLPLNGGVYANGNVPLNVTFDRPLTALTYSLNGAPAVNLAGQWVTQDRADWTAVNDALGTAIFGYTRPQYATSARWQYKYATPAGVQIVSEEIPASLWNQRTNDLQFRVAYRSDGNVLAQYLDDSGSWQTLRALGHNNPGGVNTTSALLTDGNWSTGAAWHLGAHQWLTDCGGEYVMFYEQKLLWNVQLATTPVNAMLAARTGLNTLVVTGTDALGKTTSTTVTFTVT